MHEGRKSWYGITLLLLGIPLSGNEYFYYFAFGILLLVGLYHNGFKAFFNWQKEEKYCVIMIGVWIFGIIVGVINHNPWSYMVRNLAGTIVYLLYFFIPAYVDYERKILCKTIIGASITAAIITCMAAFIYNHFGTAFWPFSNVVYNKYINSVYSSVGVLCFVLEAVSLYYIFCKNNFIWKIKWILGFLLYAYALLFANNQGGFILGFLVVMWLSVLGASIHNEKYRKIGICFIILCSLVVVIYDLCVLGIIQSVFTTQDVGNSKRFFQVKLILERFKVLGNGIGSDFSYYFDGKRYDTYSVEVSYLNCLDKYGVLCLLVFFVYIKTIMNPIKNIWRQRDYSLRNFIAIGIMGYLFVALGNPILFAPYNVFLHCISLKLSSDCNEIDLEIFDYE